MNQTQINMIEMRDFQDNISVPFITGSYVDASIILSEFTLEIIVLL